MEGHTVSGRGDGPDRPCHLLELPGELRNEIYKLALYHPGGVTFDCVTQKLLTRQPLALSMTCKQIRNESESIVFAQNDLRLESFTPIIHENQLRAGHRFLYSLLVSSRLGSKFRGVHLVTKSHDCSKPSKQGVRNHPTALSWFEMWMISLCRERKYLFVGRST